jgi:predicted nuclease of predicted toxin-antitoxin system
MNIEFLLDENIPFSFIEFIERKGFIVRHLKKIGRGGIKNGEVYQFAKENRLWIITRDSDFENYRKFVEHDVGGIIVFKLSKTKTQHLLNTMDRFFEIHRDKLLVKHLIIINDNEIKIYE